MVGERAAPAPPGKRNPLEDSGIFRLLPREYSERLIATGGKLRSERREITLLFMDIVNSTGMIETLDPEDAFEVMNGAFGELVRPITRQEGTVARLMGDGFLCFFGAPTAHEDDALRACRAALEMQEAALAYARRLQQERSIAAFQIRIGIATGMVVVGQVGASDRVEYTAMGNAANLAARLEHQAKPGGILISDATYRQVRAELECDDAGLLSIRGHSQKARAYHVLGRRKSQGTLPPERETVPVVGRTVELGLLQEALAAAEHRRGATIFLSGEAGIGKSRLVIEARRMCPPACRWIHVQCNPESRGRAYASARDAMSDLVDVPRSADALHLLTALEKRLTDLWSRPPQPGTAGVHRARPTADVPRHLSVLRKLDPRLGGDESVQGPTEDVSESVRAIFRELALQSAWSRPLVLVWEDVHWIDPSSSELLYNLLPLTRVAPLMVLVTMRTDVAGSELKRRLRARLGDACYDLHLDPLPRRDAALLAEQLLQSHLIPGAVLEQLLDRTGGNAFFLEEVVRGLLDLEFTGASGGAANTSATHAIPGNLQRAILARLDLLSPTDKYLLQTAAVLGESFSGAVLAHMLKDESKPAVLAESFARLQQREFLRAHPDAQGAPQAAAVWSFRHAVMADVAYGTLLRSQRQELHAAAGYAIEATSDRRQDERASQLAYHFERGADHPRALTYLMESAQVSLRLDAYREASDYYRRAIRAAEQCPPTPETSAALSAALEGLADAEYVTAHYREALEHFDKALANTEGQEDQVRLLRKQAQVHEKQGRHGDAEQMLVKALQQIPEAGFAGESARICGGLCRVHFHQGKLQSARELAYRALGMMTELGDRRGMAQAHNDIGIISTRDKEYAEACGHLDLSLDLWNEVGDRYGLAACFNNRGLLAAGRGDLEGSRAEYLHALAHFRRLGNRHGTARVFDNLSEVYLARGDLDRASRYVGRAVRILADIGVDHTGVLPEIWQSGAW